ncbi:MAG: hypothetical protein HYZ72_18095 [Deltaproteobacteria bacterium]|nr:hypothetical protein [Deltaproteobacteria bacterium]
MVAYPLTTWIILRSSWQTVFYINAILGFVWAAVWLCYVVCASILFVVPMRPIRIETFVPTPVAAREAAH